MSSYIPPIQSQTTYKLIIERFDPDRNSVSQNETFDIPWVPTMTVIEALEWLCDQGIYIAFRANCREFTCGSCAMVINGRAGLACDTLFTNGTTLAPLKRYSVCRDLVVDQSPIRDKWIELQLWTDTNQKQDPINEVQPNTMEAWHKQYARCIECYACLEACPTSESDNSPFAGPMWMLQIGRARAHPLDNKKVDRVAQVMDQGAGRCVSCYECAEICPVSASPINEIQVLRRAAIWSRIKGLFS